jgi:hypothetical protein
MNMDLDIAPFNDVTFVFGSFVFCEWLPANSAPRPARQAGSQEKTLTLAPLASPGVPGEGIRAFPRMV